MCYDLFHADFMPTECDTLRHNDVRQLVCVTKFGIVPCPTNSLLIFYVQRHVVAQSVEAMCYKPKGRGFDSHIYDPGVNSGCNRNENQQYFLGV